MVAVNQVVQVDLVLDSGQFVGEEEEVVVRYIPLSIISDVELLDDSQGAIRFCRVTPC